VGAAAALVVASVAIGHAVWSNPTHIAASGASNNTGTPNSGGSTLNPFGGGSGGTPFGGGTGNSGSGSGNSSVGSGPKDASSIASKVDPGLVDIDGVLGYQDDEDAGTGMVLTSNGLILTNNHVIEGATSLSVTDIGNGKTYSASVVGYDRDKDIAVIQLANASGLTTANLGNSSNVSVGQAIVGVGNAGGTGGTPSYAGGTVTALNQSITASDEGDDTSEQLTGLIETNANIQPGDSGGPLVNTSGQILGIDTAASDTYTFQGGGGSGDQGYTIPINTALSIAHEIEASDSSSTVHVGSTPFLGVQVATDASSSGGEFGFGGGGSTQTAPGALIEETVTSGPAQEAGLTEGDLITGVDGTSVSSPTALTNALLQYKAGDSVTIAYTDTSGNSHTATVKLSSGPPQ
jgi:S1-C subfamily serine protease